ncbi:MAG: hypothetical protein ACREFR_19685 [Limisphaerales bacterium]
MRSHFIPQTITAACAVAGATTLLTGSAPAQSFVAADYATNPTYGSGWSTGQNGGYGFGPWSFDGTETGTNNTSDPGAQQIMSSAAAIGTSWTLFNLTNNGISIAGRSIPGGLQPGQTFETIIQNPTAYTFYRGFDILFGNGTTNLPALVNTSALRLLVFNYFSSNWKAVDESGTTFTPLADTDTAAGMKFDLTLLSTNTYSFTMTPLADPANAYTQTGDFASTNLPINYVNYRLWDNQSTGPNDTADNFEISSMTIQGLNLAIQLSGSNSVLSWLEIPGFYLESATSLVPPVDWISNSIPPVVLNGDNVVTNPITGHRQFFRLQLQQ